MFQIEDGEDEEEEDEYWSKELTEDVAPVCKQELTEGLKSLTITEELELSEKERIDLFYEEVKSSRDAGTLASKHKELELVAMAERLEIRSKAPLVLAEVLFDQNIAAQARNYRRLILRFTFNDTKAQKYLMGGLEQIIALHKDALLPKVPHILKVR